MPKILVAGNLSCNTDWKVLLARLHTLQKSPHGPFACIFVGGSLFTSVEQIAFALEFQGDINSDSETKANKEEDIEERVLPFPCYAIDRPSFVISGDGGTILPRNFFYIENAIAPAAGTVVDVYASAGMATLHNLTVSYCNSTAADADVDALRLTSKRTAYRGCDIFLSPQWPADTHHFLQPADLSALKALRVGLGSGNTTVSQLATLLRPRYHFCGGGPDAQNVFYARPPYTNRSLSQAVAPVTRFISLHSVSEAAAANKNHKYLHALSLEPIVHMSDDAVSEQPVGTTEMPYDVAPTPDSQASKKRTVEEAVAATGGLDGGNKRARPSGESAPPGSLFFSTATPRTPLLEAPTPDATQIFIGGLPAVSNKEIAEALPGSNNVRRPEGKAFAFVDYPNHAIAASVVRAAQNAPVSIGGRVVSIGWASASTLQKNKALRSATEDKDRDGGREPTAKPDSESSPSPECRVLFLRNLPENTEGAPLLFASLTKLFVGLVACRQVPNKQYGFAEFSTPGEAQFAINYARKHGPLRVPSSLNSAGEVVSEVEIAVGWATNRNATARPEVNPLIRSLPRSSYNTSAYIPKTSASTLPTGDHAGECWFCLASSTVKTHLIVAIGEHSYLALPVGGLHPLHCLVCPIECTSNKLQLSQECLKEMEAFKQAIEKLYKRENFVMMSYERAMRTKGRDHMQCHFIPVPLDRIRSAKSAFSSTVKKLGSRCYGNRSDQIDEICATNALVLHELDIEEDRGVEQIVATMPGGPYEQYFHCSIPAEITIDSIESGEGSGVDTINQFTGTDIHIKRYVYVHDEALQTDHARGKFSFPMQIGSDIASAVLAGNSVTDEEAGEGRSKHWKHKKATLEEETSLTESFRRLFEPFDFTSS